jgi:uncharacterized protein YhdP
MPLPERESDYTHTHTHTHTHRHTDTQTQTHRQTHTHTHTRARAHFQEAFDGETVGWKVKIESTGKLACGTARKSKRLRASWCEGRNETTTRDATGSVAAENVEIVALKAAVVTHVVGVGEAP